MKSTSSFSTAGTWKDETKASRGGRDKSLYLSLSTRCSNSVIKFNAKPPLKQIPISLRQSTVTLSDEFGFISPEHVFIKDCNWGSALERYNFLPLQVNISRKT